MSFSNPVTDEVFPECVRLTKIKWDEKKILIQQTYEQVPASINIMEGSIAY